MKKLLQMVRKLTRYQVTRRDFIKTFVAGTVIAAVSGTFRKKVFAQDMSSNGRPKKDIKGKFDLVVAEGADSYTNTIKAVEAMGGMGLFVKSGDTVVVKPNIGWDRTPEQAANTDPGVVAAIIVMCKQAGAKKVKIFDVTCNDARRCYENSGIQKAADDNGAQIFFPDDWNVLKANFSYSSGMQNWPVLRDAVECDVFINVPVLKHHGLTGLTLSMKNLMGVCSGRRGLMHIDIGNKLVDMTDFIKPELTIIDGHRYLTRNGPTGGNVADVKTLNKIIVGTDPVLTDAYACKVVDIDPMAIPYLKAASTRGFGDLDIAAAAIESIKV